MGGYTYIMANRYNTVLYTEVTRNLKDRVLQHKSKKHPDSFSAKYNVCKLVYFEFFGNIGEAIKREKQINGGPRSKKIDLINRNNPEWNDLEDLVP